MLGRIKVNNTVRIFHEAFTRLNRFTKCTPLVKLEKEIVEPAASGCGRAEVPFAADRNNPRNLPYRSSSGYIHRRPSPLLWLPFTIGYSCSGDLSLLLLGIGRPWSELWSPIFLHRICTTTPIVSQMVNPENNGALGDTVTRPAFGYFLIFPLFMFNCILIMNMAIYRRPLLFSDCPFTIRYSCSGDLSLLLLGDRRAKGFWGAFDATARSLYEGRPWSALRSSSHLPTPNLYDYTNG
jgi:hypothetical protein